MIVPVYGPSGLSGVVSAEHGAPQQDELALVTVYAGYAANAIERDRLLDQVTTRNRVLETIREMLETLAGMVPASKGLASAGPDAAPRPAGRRVRADHPAARPACLLAHAFPGPFRHGRGVGQRVDARHGRDRAVQLAPGRGGPPAVQQPQAARAGGGVRGSGRPHRAAGQLAAGAADQGGTALLEDAAHSLRLALEREEAGHAHQEAAALRRSRELQRGFLPG